MRDVTPADAAMLLAWRNDPESRSASRNTALVTAPEHEAWLAKVLASPERHVIRIAELDSTPVGVVRADATGDGWELSWTVAPECRGRGIGRNMLATFTGALRGRLIAHIRQGYGASAKIAAAAGLARIDTAADEGFERWEKRGK